MACTYEELKQLYPNTGPFMDIAKAAFAETNLYIWAVGLEAVDTKSDQKTFGYALSFNAPRREGISNAEWHTEIRGEFEKGRINLPPEAVKCLAPFESMSIGKQSNLLGKKFSSRTNDISPGRKSPAPL